MFIVRATHKKDPSPFLHRVRRPFNSPFEISNLKSPIPRGSNQPNRPMSAPLKNIWARLDTAVERDKAGEGFLASGYE
jgi:hypothetical protein